MDEYNVPIDFFNKLDLGELERSLVTYRYYEAFTGKSDRNLQFNYSFVISVISQLYAENNDIFQGTRVLEAGCGIGVFGEYCKREYSTDIMGVDLALDYLLFAEQYTNGLDFLGADVKALPFKSESFDIVIAANLIDQSLSAFFSDKSIYAAIDEVSRVLKEGGIAIISGMLNEKHFMNPSLDTKKVVYTTKNGAIEIDAYTYVCKKI